MPQIEISDEMYARVAAFKPVVDAILGEEISLQEHLEHLLLQALDRLLADAIAAPDPDALLNTLRAVSRRHPTEIYGFVADVWRAVSDQKKREAMQQRFGFNQA
jgi:hypothetical protein